MNLGSCNEKTLFWCQQIGFRKSPSSVILIYVWSTEIYEWMAERLIEWTVAANIWKTDQRPIIWNEQYFYVKVIFPDEGIEQRYWTEWQRLPQRLLWEQCDQLGDFKSSWEQIFQQSSPNICILLGYFEKPSLFKYNLLWLSFGRLFEEFGILSIPTSGHIVCHSNTNAPLEAVWPEWAIFDRSWWQILFEKPKYFVSFSN